MIHTCKCGHTGNPLCACARCGELVPLSIEPKRELESLRQQLQVARSQTKSDRELIVELRDALNIFMKCAIPVAREINERGYNWSEAYLDQALETARAVLGKVTP